MRGADVKRDLIQATSAVADGECDHPGSGGAKKPAWQIVQEASARRHTYWHSLNKVEWIAAARAELMAGEAEACDICGMTAAISQFHHVIPLSDQYDRGFVTPAHYPSAWLCPNHHAMLHKFLALNDFRKFNEPRRYGLTQEQVDKLYDLVLKSRNQTRNDGTRQGATP